MSVGKQAPTLEELIELLRDYKSTPEEEWEKRISWAYGQMKLHNPNTSREMIEEAARKIEAEKHNSSSEIH